MIVADLGSFGVDVSEDTVVRALYRGGLRAIVPEEPLHSISGTCVLWSDKTKPELFQHIDFVYAW